MKRIAKIPDEATLVSAFEDLFHIAVNLRGYTKEYEHRYGVQAKKIKKFWEAKMDEIILALEDASYAEKKISGKIWNRDSSGVYLHHEASNDEGDASRPD